MKFIAFLESDTCDLDKLIDIWKSRTKAKHTVKTLFHPHTMADTPRGYSGFTIFEADDEEAIMHYVTEYSQVASVRVIPIWDSEKSSKLFQKLEKDTSLDHHR